MLWWLFNQQPVRDATNDPQVIGRVARQLLMRVAPTCEINELLRAHTRETFRTRFPLLNFPASSSDNSAPSQELVLGLILSEYRRSVAPPAGAPSAAAAAINAGLAKAFSIHAKTLRQRDAAARALSESIT